MEVNKLERKVKEGRISLSNNERYKEEMKESVVRGSISLGSDEWCFYLANPICHKRFAARFAPIGAKGFNDQIECSAPGTSRFDRLSRRNCELIRKPFKTKTFTLAAMLIAAFETGHVLEEDIEVYGDPKQISSSGSRELRLRKSTSPILERQVAIQVSVAISLIEKLQFIL
jgi:hypothetical protein